MEAQKRQGVVGGGYCSVSHRRRLGWLAVWFLGEEREKTLPGGTAVSGIIWLLIF